MINKLSFAIPASLVLMTFASSSVYLVNQQDKAILFRLGEIADANLKPGLHFKTPVINHVSTFDARVLTLDAKSEHLLTSDRKNVIVDSFAKWRIGDVGLFYTRVSGDEFQANLRLDQIVKDAMRHEFSVRTLQELLSQDRSELHADLLNKLRPLASEFGLELIDIRVNRIDLPTEVNNSIFQRMRAEREAMASELRGQGSESAEKIRAEADKQRQVIVANAQREAENIRGGGDAQAAEIYAKSYGKNPDFFAFYRNLQSYQTSFDKAQDTLVLKPDREFLKYFSRDN